MAFDPTKYKAPVVRKGSSEWLKEVAKKNGYIATNHAVAGADTRSIISVRAAGSDDVVFFKNKKPLEIASEMGWITQDA